MSINNIRKFAIILNGGDAKRHRENVERSSAVLKNEGFEVYVASPIRPKNPVDQYVGATLEGVRKLTDEIRSKTDENDVVRIYVTGHGGWKGGESCVELEDGCHGADLAALLDIRPYGRREVVMDQCFGGGLGKYFTDDPASLFISASSADEVSFAQEFPDPFWSGSVPDVDGDGVISLRERYEHAVRNDQLSFTPRFLPGKGYAASRFSPFGRKVVEVADQDALAEQLTRLRPGHYAVLCLDDPGLGRCPRRFGNIAKYSAGQVLFLKTKSREIADKYAVRKYPAFIVMDNKGYGVLAEDMDGVFSTRARFEIPLAQRIKKLRSRDVEDPMRRDALVRALILAVFQGYKEGKRGEVEGLLKDLSSDPDKEVAAAAKRIAGKLFMKILQINKPLESVLYGLLNDDDPETRRDALAMAGEVLSYLNDVALQAYARGIRNRLQDQNVNVRHAAIETYPKLVFYMPAGKREKMISSFLYLLEDKNRFIAEKAVEELFLGIIPALHPEEQGIVMEHLLQNYGRYSREVRYLTAGNWKIFTRFVSSRLFQKEAKLVETMLSENDSDVVGAAIEAANAVGGWIAAMDQQGDRVVTALAQVLKNFGDIHKLNRYETVVGTKHVEKVLGFLAILFEKSRISQKTAGRIAVILVPLLLHPSRAVRLQSTKTYMKLARHLSVQQRKTAAQTFLKVFDFYGGHRNSEAKLWAMTAYTEAALCLDGLPEEQKKEIRPDIDELEDRVWKLVEMAKDKTSPYHEAAWTVLRDMWQCNPY